MRLNPLNPAILSTATRSQLIAMTLSDPFCVDRFRSEFLGLIRDGTVDTVFANADEVRSLYESDDLEAATERLASEAALAVVTHGAEGSVAVRGEERARAKAWPVTAVDTTGAGDLYAAGFLAGVIKGHDLSLCTRLGAFAAGRIVAQIGPRPSATLLDDARAAGVV